MKISATSYVTITKIVVTILPLVNVSESSTSVWFPAGQPAVPPSSGRSINTRVQTEPTIGLLPPAPDKERPVAKRKGFTAIQILIHNQLLFTNLTISRNEVDKRESSPTT